MAAEAIIVAGIEVPLVSPFFLGMVGFHVVAGALAMITGIATMLSKKQPGRHPRLGTGYFCCLSAVFASATLLSIVQWAEDYHLFILGTLSFGTACVGRTARRHRWRGWVRWHIPSMGCRISWLLTTFYVDNGHSLPNAKWTESLYDSLLEGNGFELPVRWRGQFDCRSFAQPVSSSSRAHSGRAGRPGGGPCSLSLLVIKDVTVRKIGTARFVIR